MELWDVLDENGNKTGRTVERGQPMAQNEYHLVVHVWVVNSKGEFLISKRSPDKSFPNMWESAGGSAIAGEDSLTAAIRETREELGIVLDPQNSKLFRQYQRHHCDFPDFVDVWLFTCPLLYRDVYYGFAHFSGQEVVYFSGDPVWSMVYSGGTCETLCH